MALSTARSFRPRIPGHGAFDPIAATYSYDRSSDTLMIHFLGGPRPAVCLDAGPHLYLRVDPHSKEIVGLQIEHFLGRGRP